MKRLGLAIVPVVTLLLLTSQPGSAQPTFQVYSPDYIYAGDYYEDQDTWLVIDNPFELWTIGAYNGKVTSLTDVTLIISVPDGQTGTVSITGLPGSGTADPSYIGSYSDRSFFPSGANFNSHYPLQDDVSDFLLYDLDPFSNVGDQIWDYNADDGGSATPTGTTGQIKEYRVAVSGVDWAHFDMYGLEGKQTGPEWKSSWHYHYELSPGSHDVTQMPAPGGILLGSIGVALVGWLRRRRAL